MSGVAISFGAATFLLFLWSFSYSLTRILAAGILFAGWGISLGSQLILSVDTPIDIYWATDFVSALAFFALFVRFRGWWLWAIGILYIPMVGAHVLYAGGLHAYYHYWVVTSLFAAQIAIVAGRLLYDRYHKRRGDICQPDISRVGGKSSGEGNS